MRKVLRRGFQEFEILSWRDIRFLEFKDRFSTLQFLRDFIDDPHAMMHLRDLIGRESAFKNVSALSDSEVLEEIASLLLAKRLRVITRFDTLQPSTFITPPPEAEAEPEAPPFEAPPDRPAEEPAAVDPALTAAAENQAAVLTQAARSGAPLCEA